MGDGKDVITTINANGLYQFGQNTTHSPSDSEPLAQWYILACAVTGGYFMIALRTNLEHAYIGYSTTGNNWIGWHEL